MSAARLRLDCGGVVQGVGFRPAVHRLAARLGLSGSLHNAPGLVRLELHGEREDLERFLLQLPAALPPGAHLDPLAPRWLESEGDPAAEPAGITEAPADQAPMGRAPRGRPELRISAGPQSASHPLTVGLMAPALVADRAPCARCRQELDDPLNRRHGDPFLSCCACGPRYAIATAEPWRRAHTTLAAFPPCPACSTEFSDPTDRRFHAETISCPLCGPRLSLLIGPEQQPLGPPPAQGLSASAHHAALIAAAADLLAGGRILALQGVGGFQLLVDAGNPVAVARLRRRKRRPAKPFALLVVDPGWLADPLERGGLEPGALPPAALTALSSPAAPIVLLPRRRPRSGPDPLATVAPFSPHLGVMLPASPLHLLLARRFGRPLVCTSGNRSGEPLCTDPGEALHRLSGIADAFLIHDRPIARPLDDSLLQLIDGQPCLLRRARGYAPEPVVLPGVSHAEGALAAERQAGWLLALGGDLKSAPALAAGGRVWLAPQQGDLSDPRHHARLAAGLAELRERHGSRLERIACDLHPGYLSHQLASALADPAGTPPLLVQHHAAHALAVIAEHGLRPPLLAFCADGLGYGDQTAQPPNPPLWGGELLHVTPTAIERLAALRPLPLPGGERACLEPRRAALGLLAAAGPWALEHAGAARSRAAFRPADRELLLQLLGRGVHYPWSSSLGRLFDAVASLLGVCQRLSFEGEGGLRLQGLATEALTEAAAAMASRRGVHAFPLRPWGGIGDPPAQPRPDQERPQVPLGWLDWEPALAALLRERAAGVPRPISAARFHLGLIEGLAQLLRAAADSTGCREVVLAGGCFQNALLLEGLIRRLRDVGLQPRWASAVPGNDGGLALGQVEALRRAGRLAERQPSG